MRGDRLSRLRSFKVAPNFSNQLPWQCPQIGPRHLQLHIRQCFLRSTKQTHLPTLLGISKQIGMSQLPVAVPDLSKTQWAEFRVTLSKYRRVNIETAFGRDCENVGKWLDDLCRLFQNCRQLSTRFWVTLSDVWGCRTWVKGYSKVF